MKTQMPFNKEIEEVKAQLKVLQNKLEELEKRPSPAEEAFKEFYGAYPITDIVDTSWDSDGWVYFEAGYNAAYKEKVVKQKDDYPYKKYTPEETEQSLKEAFRQAVKQGVVSSSNKSKTLSDLIYDWWGEVFTTHSDWSMETSIENLIDEISLWLPTEHETNSYKWNECIRTIREKLR
jgi:hypothetical protein